jgi:uncharacterized membrane-anchored protein YhcB (DUF1043 family)
MFSTECIGPCLPYCSNLPSMYIYNIISFIIGIIIGIIIGYFYEKKIKTNY